MIKIIAVLCILFSGMQEGNMSTKDESKIALTEAIKIGAETLKKSPYNLKYINGFNVIADDNNSKLNETLKRTPSLKKDPYFKSMNLENREYWAIYYYPKKDKKQKRFVQIGGGEAWVFIDRKNGVVIGVIRIH